MWTWQECEDCETRRGDISVVDDWGAAGQRYLSIGPNSSARFAARVEGKGEWTLCLRYRRQDQVPATLTIVANGVEHQVELACTGDRKHWGWVTALAAPGEGDIAVELRTGDQPCQADGFFLYNKPFHLPGTVEQLNALAGQEETRYALDEFIRLIQLPEVAKVDFRMPSAFPSEIAKAAAGEWWPVLESLAGKPCPYIVNVYDVGKGTDYNSDYAWHALDKEKLWQLPASGLMGVVNPNSDVYYALGFGLEPRGARYDVEFRPVLHLADILIYRVDLGPLLRCEALFRCYDSDTIVAAVFLSNLADVDRKLFVSDLIGKDPLENPPPQRYVLRGQKFGSGVETTAGGLAWQGAVGGVPVCFYEWVRNRSRGRRLLVTRSTVGNGIGPAPRPGQAEPRGPCPPQVARNSTAVFVPARGVSAVAFSINLRRFTLQDTWNPELTPNLYRRESEEDAVEAGYLACEEALADDVESAVRSAVEPYRKLPRITLPIESWEADFYSCLEMIRASTFNPLGEIRAPFYNFCRVHAHEPFNWWSYGMHGHENEIILFTNYFAPELSADFLRGHFQFQTPEGKYPYGVSHTKCCRTMTEEATLPLIVWEAWLTYLWSGDREFLKEAYESGKRNMGWYLETRDRTGEGLCHYCNVSWETSRDDNGLPTWVVTGGAMYQEALDLNCYLLVQERTLSEMAAELGKKKDAKQFREQADSRARLMNAYMWHDEDRVYYGIGEVVPSWANVKDISTFFPLWSKLAPEGRFESIAALIADPETFGTPFGPPTLAKNEPGFGPEKHWFGSNWVEMTVFVIQGLRNYGYYQLAADLAHRNTKMVFDVLEKEGHFREYFNSVEGSGTDLIDYVWTAMPAYFIVGTLFGIEPRADHLEVLPALPKDWPEISIEALSVRGKRISVRVARNARASATVATFKGEPFEVADNRGVRIPWDRIEDGDRIEIVQPTEIPETHAAPPEAPADWSDVPPHTYPDDEDLVATVRAAMKDKSELA